MKAEKDEIIKMINNGEVGAVELSNKLLVNRIWLFKELEKLDLLDVYNNKVKELILKLLDGKTQKLSVAKLGKILGINTTIIFGIINKNVYIKNKYEDHKNYFIKAKSKDLVKKRVDKDEIISYINSQNKKITCIGLADHFEISRQAMYVNIKKFNLDEIIEKHNDGSISGNALSEDERLTKKFEYFKSTFEKKLPEFKKDCVEKGIFLSSKYVYDYYGLSYTTFKKFTKKLNINMNEINMDIEHEVLKAILSKRHNGQKFVSFKALIEKVLLDGYDFKKLGYGGVKELLADQYDIQASKLYIKKAIMDVCGKSATTYKKDNEKKYIISQIKDLIDNGLILKNHTSRDIANMLNKKLNKKYTPREIYFVLYANNLKPKLDYLSNLKDKNVKSRRVA